MVPKAVEVLSICAWAFPVDVDLKYDLESSRDVLTKTYVPYDTPNSFSPNSFCVCVQCYPCITVFFFFFFQITYSPGVGMILSL